MTNFLNFIKGKKTYLIALGIGLVAAAEFLGFIDGAVVALLKTLLLGGGLAALRDALPSRA